MLSESSINNYIDNIPPIPKVVKDCRDLLNAGDLIGAAKKASQDRALMNYLYNIVNKPIFGFAKEVKNPNQIFGALGLSKAKQVLYGYYILLILPKEWEVFHFSNSHFQNFQARLIYNWGKLIAYLKNDNDELNQAISVVPASLVVCEMLFRDIKDSIKLLKEKKDLSYEKFLMKMTGRTFFDITALIAKKWEFSDKTMELLVQINSNEQNCPLEMDFLKLLLSYEMSRPDIIKSGLNDLFEIDITDDEKIIEIFYDIIKRED
ncbi:hypothetical protein ACKGJI_07410 [Sulfurospirillum sp. 1307]|jgi:HD-like signal output (HDOD) protein